MKRTIALACAGLLTLAFAAPAHAVTGPNDRHPTAEQLRQFDQDQAALAQSERERKAKAIFVFVRLVLHCDDTTISFPGHAPVPFHGNTGKACEEHPVSP
jgi:hypothetical protein